jgi:Uncharacterised nucleotidyltransferase
MASKSNLAIYPDRRPEVEMLLACARTGMNSDATRRVEHAPQDGIDWDYLICAALYHGTAPLLFRNLSRISFARIPDATLQQLRRIVGLMARWSLSLTGELLELLARFHEIGIRALPLKGPVLAAAAYGDLSLRPFGDLDILMPRDDIPKAKDVLLQRGYRPALQLTASDEQAYLQSHHDYKFSRSRDGIIVELQWGVTQLSFAFPLDFDEMWHHRGEICVAGSVVPTIVTEDLLLALCVHGAKHRWDRLKWICDVAEIVDRSQWPIDWNRLMTDARKRGGQRMLLLGLFLARDLLDAILPDKVLKTIRNDSQIKLLAGRVVERLFRERSQPDELLDERPFFYWRVRERLRDKLAIALRYFPEYFYRLILPNVKDRAFFRLPASLAPGYYLVRPVRLVKNYWSEFKGRARGAGK